MTVNEFRITSRPPRPSPFVPSSESSQTAIRIVYHSKANTTTHTQTLSLVAAGACTIHASHYVLVVVHTRALSLIAPNKFEINILALAWKTRHPVHQTFVRFCTPARCRHPQPRTPTPLPPPAVARNAAPQHSHNRPNKPPTVRVYPAAPFSSPSHLLTRVPCTLSGIPRIYFSLYQTRINQIKQWLSLDLILNGWRHARSHKYGNIWCVCLKAKALVRKWGGWGELWSDWLSERSGSALDRIHCSCGRSVCMLVGSFCLP